MKVKIEIESDEDIQSANLVFTYKGDKVAVKSVELINDNVNNSTDSNKNKDIEPTVITEPASIITPKKNESLIKDSFGELKHIEGIDKSFDTAY